MTVKKKLFPRGATLALLLFVQFSAPGIELTETNAAAWGTFASDSAVTSISNDSSHVKVGAQSLKFTTASGFDTGVRYPAAATAHWNLATNNYLRFWAYAINTNAYGFQGNQPVIVLKTAGGNFNYTPQGTLMFNRTWHLYRVPLAGDSTWVRTTNGTPTLADVNQLEIHQDTWEYGFTIYYDGLEFVTLTPGGTPPAGPPPPPGVNPDAMEPKVLLCIFDPIMENKGGQRMHNAYGWLDPALLTTQIVSDLRSNSHDLVRYQIVETQIVDGYPFLQDGFQYTDASFDAAISAHQPHVSPFDYNRFIADFGIAPRVENGELDEVWVYCGNSDYFRMWESTMAGDGGYWCNSSPVPGVPSSRLFVVMGWNFERGVAEAIHSYGHRAESIMVHSYGAWLPNQSNNWNKFTLLNKNAPGLGGVGNVHFPVNGLNDYEYDNQTNNVPSNCDDWYNYPNFTGITRTVNSSEWSPTHADPHRDYLRWWYHHLPHFGGKGPDQFLKNWWRYIADPDQFKSWDGNLFFSSGIPSVNIIGPTNGATVCGKVAVTVNASVDGALGRVDLYADGVYQTSDTMSPYTFKWDAAAFSGNHTLVAKAYELQNGTESVSAPVVVNVLRFAISGLEKTQTGWTIHCDTCPGTTNQLQSSTVIGTAWQDVAGVQVIAGPGQTAVNLPVTSSTNAPQIFYRVKMLSP